MAALPLTISFCHRASEAIHATLSPPHRHARLSGRPDPRYHRAAGSLRAYVTLVARPPPPGLRRLSPPAGGTTRRLVRDIRWLAPASSLLVLQGKQSSHIADRWRHRLSQPARRSCAAEMDSCPGTASCP